MPSRPHRPRRFPMPPASPDTFVPLFEINGGVPAARPVRLRLAAANLPVRPLREWGNGEPALRPGAPSPPSATASPLSASTAETPAAPLTPGPCASPSQPMVTVCRDGDRVVALQIRCRCGEVINLVCAYEEGSREPSIPPSSGCGPGGA